MSKKSEKIKCGAAATKPAKSERGRGRPRKNKLDPAAKETKKSPGRPKGSTSKGNIKSSSEITDNKEHIDLVDRLIDDELVNFKELISESEQKYIELYFTGKYSREKAMELAGYGDLHPSSQYRLAKKIEEKYERQAEDHRNIFRAIGLGEIKIAQGILDLCRNAKSEVVKLHAYALAAKCLGLQREVIESGAGVTLIIAGRDDQHGEAKIGPAGPRLEAGNQPPPPSAPPKVVSIIR